MSCHFLDAHKITSAWFYFFKHLHHILKIDLKNRIRWESFLLKNASHSY
jgi:hypothetical protein